MTSRSQAACAEADELPQARSAERLSSVYACVFLVFLVFPVVEAWSRGGWQQWLGVGAVAAFCVVYPIGYFGGLVRWRSAAGLRQWSMWGWLGALLVLVALLVASSGAYAATAMTFVACGVAAETPSRVGMVGVVLSGLATSAVLLAFGVAPLTALAIGLWVAIIGFSVWGSVNIGRRRESVVELREQRAELAVERERTRLARDLHDILGHSLTVITVKAELAGRLVDVDPQKAKAELADLERLSRDALADIRTTVSDYRRLSLPGEIARAGRALAAAGIRAVTPSAADDVRTELRDPFAWVVREGVTNVIRHSGATTCAIELTPTSVEVRDDGRAVSDADAVLAGNGLTGLRERARQAGLRIVTERAHPHGFVLRAEEDA